MRLRQHEAAPAELAGGGEQIRAGVGGILDGGPHPLHRALALEHLARGASKQLLFVAQADLHHELRPGCAEPARL